MTTTKVEKMIELIDEEIHRSKVFLNENGFDNSTAVNAITRRYRKELKEYRSVIAEDRDAGLIDYKDLK